ncbi:protein polybromo-1 isoform X2 [Nematostella vectensis]|uniref:protein polybromo-1 isoform X2 n=1 Tax=Nematostella vectensis TaxID=45351 RepID=UPI002076E86B|nr:protein polybromo-1 isoform X2 [Nematostella vectensis]
MVKRRQEGSSADSGAKSSDEATDSAHSSKEMKRRKLSSTRSLDPTDLCSELYEAIRNYRSEDGRVLCEAFIRVPKRRSSPEYYDVISTPIDLLKIQQRLKTDEYEDVGTFTADMELLLDNALKYYKPDSQEYQDATQLKQVFDELKEEQGSGDNDESDDAMEEEMEVEEKRKPGRPGRPPKDASKTKILPSGDEDDTESSSTEGDLSSSSQQFYEEMVGAVLEMQDSHGRIICELFKRLPPKDLYPEYYAVIKEPIDLKMISTRVRSSYYSTIEDLEKDLQVMVKNAHTFNEPGSQVYKDASAIKKTIQAKKAEIEHTLLGAKSSSRLKARRSSGRVSSAVSALLEEEDDQAMYQATEGSQEDQDDDAGGDDDVGGEDDAENPLMMLFNEIYQHTDPTGRPMVEPFLRLPSRRAYPDYYEVIKKPIALMKIRSQIKSGLYDSLEALETELELCFNNAKTYNEPNSMLYKDAERMLDHMSKKKTEIVQMMADKGINLDEFLKTKGKARKSEASDGASVASPAPHIPVPQVKQMKEMKKKKKVAIDGKEKPKKKKGEEVDPMILKKRMRQLFKAVTNYQDESGRYLSAIFMDLPSSEEYPDYYKVISEPVCLSQIEGNIRDNKYATEEELLLDFEVMFDNARYYNEEESQVYQDACLLEKVLRKKKKSLGALPPVGTSEGASPAPAPSGVSSKLPTPTKSGRISSSPGVARKYYQVPSATSELKELCRELFNAVKDCTDGSGRQLCIIFQKLPSRAEYPDYYTLIKKPIDMAKIQSKLNGDQYQTLDDFMADFHLMFDNACKYNEPDSQVYKDSLTLLRSLLRKKAELVGDENRIPNASFLVQKLLMTLYSSVMQHVDEEGRCYSDSLAELTVRHTDAGGERKISLENMGEMLKRYQYHRLDKFQEDMFSIFEKARKISHSDCEMYDDASELQVYFITQRDKLCKEGERLISPALLVTRRHLQQELDEERKIKAEQEALEEAKQKELEKNTVTSDMTASNDESGVEELSLDGNRYQLGDFVYVEPRESNLQPHVVLIEKLWVDTSGEKWLYGNWYYRPEETFHLATRKFLEKEVFKSDYFAPAKISKVLGKCHVMSVKEYFKQKPEGFHDNDVFVCESRYTNRNKSFKKIKLWPSQTSNVKLIVRDTPLAPKRVSSVFAPNKLDQTEAMDTDDADDTEVDTRRNVVLENYPNPEEGCTYFEQLCIRDMPYKLGDSVYIRSDEDYLYIARLDKIWTDRNGEGWVHGPWFIGPGETQHLPSKMFYEQEVFLSSLEEVSPAVCIMGKCMVLPLRDYVRCRPTEIAEKDVYLNEARYDEEEGQFRKLKGLKRYSLSINCNEEEFYYFEEAITPLKVPSPLLFEDQDMMAAGERSNSPTSIDSTDSGKKTKKRGQSGYLLFSHEMRGIIRKEHPEYAFGEISRLIGEEWRNASAARKAEYENKAQMQLSQLETESLSRAGHGPTTMFVYDCMWRGCDYQYEDLQDLRVHVLDSSNHLRKQDDGFYHCLWATCTRARRGARPYNSSAKLFRHCREVHLVGPPRIVAPLDRSKNFFPRHQASFTEPSPDSSPPPPRTPVAPSTSPAVSLGPAAGGMGQGVMGMNQGNAMAGQFQGNTGTVSSPTQYGMGGRMIPQPSMQQAIYNNNNAQGNTMFNNQNMPQTPTLMMQRQMQGMGMTPQPQQQTPSMPGQSPSYQQTYSQSQQQFSFQPAMNPLQQMSQMSPVTPQPAPQPTNQMPPQQANQFNQINQYQPATPQHQQGAQPQNPVQQVPLQPSQPEVPAPVFIAPPSKPQRLHHSEAYLRYIEGLRDGNPHMSNWTQSRKPDAATMTPQQLAQLPVHWLGNSYGDFDNPVDALWALKEHMMKDALSLSRFGEP